jgi:hypothetical protein
VIQIEQVRACLKDLRAGIIFSSTFVVTWTRGLLSNPAKFPNFHPGFIKHIPNIRWWKKHRPELANFNIYAPIEVVAKCLLSATKKALRDSINFKAFGSKFQACEAVDNQPLMYERRQSSSQL